MKIAVFGSAFNPPTYSHLRIIEKLSLVFDKVLVVPCYSHNFGKKMVDFEHRFNMAKLLIEHLPDKVGITDIEVELFQHEVSRTYTLLKALKTKYPDDDFVFACGVDNAMPESWSRFYNHDLIDKEFGKYVIESQGTIRSTLIRSYIKESKSIEGMTDPKVINYINENKIEF